jgi:hypothetical protein
VNCSRAAIIEIAGIAERFDNFGEFRAELVGMSEGIITIAKNKAKQGSVQALLSARQG